MAKAQKSEADTVADPHQLVRDLAAKGEGTLVRVGNVWTYPGAPMDPSGTNLRLPYDYVSDDAVRAAADEGVVVTTTTDHTGRVLAMRIKADDSDVGLLTTAQAGTAEAGEELPVGSRPSLDAGSTTISPNEAMEQAKARLENLGKKDEMTTGRTEPTPEVQA